MSPLHVPSQFPVGMNIGDANAVTVTAGSPAHNDGAWVELFASLAAPSYGIWLMISNVSVSNELHNVLVDVGIGAASSEVVIINDLDGSSASTAGRGIGKCYYFPLYLPVGARIAVRSRANTASKTATVYSYVQQGFQYPPKTISTVTTYGADGANSRGTAVLPAGGFGNWIQITSGTSVPHRFWQFCIGPHADSSTVDSDQPVGQIGFGPDASNVTAFMQQTWRSTNVESMSGPLPVLFTQQPVPAGTPLWMRISDEATNRSGIIYAGS